jgi:hypothetical protein
LFPERLRAEVRDIKRLRREMQLRAGRVKPRTQAEAEIFAADLLADRPTDGQQPG